MYGVRPTGRYPSPIRQAYPPNALLPEDKRYKPISLKEYTWRSSWPNALTNAIAILMLILTLVIVILEVVHLCLTTVAQPFKPVGTTAAGFWCSIFFALAALFILIANLIKRKSFVSVTIAFLFVLLSLAFSAVLIGFNSKTVSKYNFSLSPKIKFIGAQLGFACGVALLNLIFIFIYFLMLCISARRFKNAQRTIPPTVQPFG